LFEAAACGTPVLSDSWAGLELFFEPGSEIIVAQNGADAVAALDLSDATLAQVARRARERVMDEHTAAHRARHLETLIENTVNAPAEAELSAVRETITVQRDNDLVEA